MRLPAILVTALALAACSPSAELPMADLILTGGSVVTMGGTQSDTSVALRAGRVLAVGPAARIARHDGPGTRTIDLEGATVAPAWVDHHVHLLNIGLSLLNQERADALFIDLSGMSQAEIDEALRTRATTTPTGSWLLGKGWSQGNWGEQLLPDRDQLDPASGDRPTFLGRVDGHAAWVDSAALAAAGIDASSPDPTGGRIERRADGTPTGVLLERATEAVQALLPRPPVADLVLAFGRATAALAEQGVVEVYDAGFLSAPGVVNLGDDLSVYLDALLAADRERPLPVRVDLMIPAPTALAETVLADPDVYRQMTPRVGVTHIKLFADGAMGSRGAWLDEPFADDPRTNGVPRMSEEEIRNWSTRALDAGFDVATHAIGNAALAAVLDVYEGLLAARTDLDPRRLRIEHVSYGNAADLQRAAALGVVLSIQPNFVFPDDEGVAMEDSRLGAERTGTVYAWGTLRRAGAQLAFGSDYFTFPFPPLFTLHAATTRSNFDGLPADGWHPDERLDRTDALAAMSTLYRPGNAGPHRHHVAAGEPADLVILSADPLAVGDLLAVRVLATLVAGKPVHDDGTIRGLRSPRQTPTGDLP